MIASRIRLPKNENPRIEELDKEDKNILAAFRIVFDGYRRAQDRTRAVIRAYNELESVASSLLRERRENRDESSPPRENNESNRRSSSPPRIDIDEELADVLLVDLTSDFDFEQGARAVAESRTPSPIVGLTGKTIKPRRSAEERTEETKSARLRTGWNQIGTKSESKTREGNEQEDSPLGKTCWTRKSAEEKNLAGVAEATKSTRLGTGWNQIGTKTESKTREGNEKDDSPLSKTSWTRKSAEETNFAGVAEATKSTRLGTGWNQIGTKTESKSREGNENSPLIGNSAGKIAASGSRDGDSRPSVKLSLTKCAYRIDKSKASSGKTTKQSTLVFQPIAAKVDITCSEKNKAQSSAARHWANLFDEDYRVKKTTTERESTVAAEKKDPPRAEEEKFDRAVESPSRVSSDGAARSKTKTDNVVNNCMIMETPSQIDESARSLFEDEDLEDFQISQDFLNTCMDAPALADLAKRKEDDSGAGRKIDDATSSTPKASQQLLNGLDSIDETFFAPGEVHSMKNVVEKRAEVRKPSTILTLRRAGEFHPMNNVVKKPAEVSKPVAGCSTILTPKRRGDNDRSLKRKTGEESIEKDVLEDLDLRESDWDTDLWNENCPPTKRPLNNSFDIVPEKKRKSPEFFYRGKMGRSKDKLHKVTGWSCRECENYYGRMNLPEADLRRRLEACRRHTSKMPKYCTPKDFWNPEFSDTMDSSD